MFARYINLCAKYDQSQRSFKVFLEIKLEPAFLSALRRIGSSPSIKIESEYKVNLCTADYHQMFYKYHLPEWYAIFIFYKN